MEVSKRPFGPAKANLRGECFAPPRQWGQTPGFRFRRRAELSFVWSRRFSFLKRERDRKKKGQQRDNPFDVRVQQVYFEEPQECKLSHRHRRNKNWHQCSVSDADIEQSLATKTMQYGCAFPAKERKIRCQKVQPSQQTFLLQLYQRRKNEWSTIANSTSPTTSSPGPTSRKKNAELKLVIDSKECQVHRAPQISLINLALFLHLRLARTARLAVGDPERQIRFNFFQCPLAFIRPIGCFHGQGLKICPQK